VIFFPEPSTLVVKFGVLRASNRTLGSLLFGLPVFVKPSTTPQVAQGGAPNATCGCADWGSAPERNNNFLFLGFFYLFVDLRGDLEWEVLKVRFPNPNIIRMSFQIF